jgi:hypothetical protein
MRKKDSLWTSFKALLCVLNSKCLLDNLVEKDFEKELESNQQLANSDDNAREEFRKELVEATRIRARLLRRRLLLSLGWILFGIVGSFVLVLVFDKDIIKKLNVPSILGMLSILSFSVATLSRLGWEGQSWKGNTVVEQLDTRLFWLLYLLGTGLGVAAFLI